MGLFDSFKKKKKEVKIDFNLNELKVGFMVDYFMQTWEVKKVYLYDWGNNIETREYLIDSGKETYYLHIEDDDKLKCSLSQKIELRDIDPGLAVQITSQDDAPQQIVFEGITYHRVSSGQGYCGEEGDNDEDYSNFVNWMFENENDFISIDRWGEEEFSAAKGSFVKEIEFSNILPK
ncbi:MAG: hypothetical protein COC01_01005 [Bacteroidetes bacterium]|nr:DUF4178 domain-containing protein [Bacteroidia bacterium]PCH69697.1 MAG: hypothetical protein COC01_01005 [Bacteroidota bacterium]